jgi:hypothetical protein
MGYRKGDKMIVYIITSNYAYENATEIEKVLFDENIAKEKCDELNKSSNDDMFYYELNKFNTETDVCETL